MSKWTTKEKISITLFIVGVLIGLPVLLWLIWTNIVVPDATNLVGSWVVYPFFLSIILLVLSRVLAGFQPILELIRKYKKPS